LFAVINGWTPTNFFWRSCLAFHLPRTLYFSLLSFHQDKYAFRAVKVVIMPNIGHYLRVSLQKNALKASLSSLNDSIGFHDEGAGSLIMPYTACALTKLPSELLAMAPVAPPLCYSYFAVAFQT
jgi:hypothetical protein